MGGGGETDDGQDNGGEEDMSGAPPPPPMRVSKWHFSIMGGGGASEGKWGAKPTGEIIPHPPSSDFATLAMWYFSHTFFCAIPPPPPSKFSYFYLYCFSAVFVCFYLNFPLCP